MKCWWVVPSSLLFQFPQDSFKLRKKHLSCMRHLITFECLCKQLLKYLLLRLLTDYWLNLLTQPIKHDKLFKVRKVGSSCKRWVMICCFCYDVTFSQMLTWSKTALYQCASACLAEKRIYFKFYTVTSLESLFLCLFSPSWVEGMHQKRVQQRPTENMKMM